MKQRATGFIYITTGLLVIIFGIILTGMMLGITTAIFSLTSLLIPPLFIVGPLLLILTGITEVLGRAHHPTLWAITGGTVLSLLAAWTIPSVGLRLAAWLILEPVGVALLIAVVIMHTVKKSWIKAVIGSTVTAPFFLYGSATTIYGYFSNGVFAWQNFGFLRPRSFSLLVSFSPCIHDRLESMSLGCSYSDKSGY